MKREPGPRLDKQPRLLSSATKYAPISGLLGVQAYLLGSALPLPWDLPLIILAVSGVVAARAGLASSVSLRTPLVWSVLLLTAITGLQCVYSVNWEHSARLSVSLFPAVLLFLLMTQSIPDIQAMRRLYFTLVLMGGGLALALLVTRLVSEERSPTLWIAQLGSPLMLVPNDCLLLALLAPLAPLALALLWCERSQLIRGLTLTMLLLSGIVIVLYQSRSAFLTFVGTLVCTALWMRPRRTFLLCAVAVGGSALLDGMWGFPLLTKFFHLEDARMSLWRIAWEMFADSPVVGQGPHTFGLLYRTYLHHTVLPEWLLRDPHGNVPWAHNLYVELLAEQGIVGFLSFALVAATSLRVAWNAHQAATSEIQPLLVGAGAGLIGLYGAALCELTLLRQWVVITLLLFLGIVTRLASLQHQGRDSLEESILPHLFTRENFR